MAIVTNQEESMMANQRSTDPQLSEREMLIAKMAAELAVKQMMDSFYTEVGRTVVQRMLIIIGAAAVGLAYGKGWISFPGIFK